MKEIGEAAGAGAQTSSSWLASLMKKFSLSTDEEDAPKPEQLLPEVSFDGVVQYINSDKCRHVIVMAGAGISTSAGIPDFRSPGTGLYDNLQKYDLPNPQAIFDIGYFRQQPEAFFQLAKDLWPGLFKPTPSHYFIRMLSENGLLLRHFTQNIDTLERVAGLDADKLMEAHGTFHTSHCLDCRKEYSQAWIKSKIFADELPKCDEEACGGLVKPDIIFFGEALPPAFFKAIEQDLPKCDLLIVMGTSLVVQPFASLCTRVPETTPRLYINMENTTGNDPLMAMLGMGSDFKFDQPDNYRDVFWRGTCDDGCYALADKLGWGKELRKLVSVEHARIMAENQADT